MRIDLNICTKDRPTELAMLLQSLRTQDFQEFDIYILDDGGGTPIMNFHFINSLITRLKCEGHYVAVIGNQQSVGISKARQQLADYCIAHSKNAWICRQDDDTILERDYLSKLVSAAIESKADLVSSVTPPLGAPLNQRRLAFAKPVMNRVVLGLDGTFVFNGDDCGHSFFEDEIVLCDHFRSSALYKKEVHTKHGIKYDDCRTPCGFREEEFFSFRMILAGLKLVVRTGAVCWHVMTPSGGDRRQNYAEMSIDNQKLLNRQVRKWYEKHGDFIAAYEKKHLGKAVPFNPEHRAKNTNLIYAEGE